MGSLAIITGSLGTGKTTLAAHLAASEPHGVHVPSDVFYSSSAHPISPEGPEANVQNEDVIVAATRTAAAFASRGYEVLDFRLDLAAARRG